RTKRRNSTNSSTSSSSPPNWTTTPMKETTAVRSPSIILLSCARELRRQEGELCRGLCRQSSPNNAPTDHFVANGRLKCLCPTMIELSELETPALVVDLETMDHNLDRAAEYAKSHGIALRPHIKTHKSPVLAREQLDRGAAGLTCATPY